MDPTAPIRQTLATTTFIARRMLRHWPWLIAGFVVTFGAAAAYTATRTEVFRSETLVQVSPAILADFVPGAEPGADDLKQRIHQLTLSRTRLEQVLGELQPYAARRDLDSTEAVLQHFRDHLSIEMHGTDTFLLSFDHEEPAVAQAVTRRVVELFIQERSSARTARVVAASQLLRGQVTSLLEGLGRREDALSTFKEEHRAELAALLRRATPTSDRPVRQPVADPPYALDGAAARELAALRAQRATALAALRSLQTAAQGSAEADRLRAEIAEAQRERSQLLERFTNDYPTVQENTRRLAALQRQLAAALAPRPGQQQDAGALALSQQIADLDADIARVQRQATLRTRPTAQTPAAPPPHRLSLPEVEAQLAHLEADVSTVREQHRQATGRLFEAEFAVTVESQRAAESVKVIDPASRPTRPVSPNRAKLLGAGAALALLLGLLLAFLAGALDTRIFEEGDLARSVSIPVLVTIPVYEHRGA